MSSSSNANKFLLDKIRPDRPIDLGFNKEAWDLLSAIAHANTFPHVIIYGPSGSGKKLMIRHLLRELYGMDVEKMHQTNYKVASAGNTTKKAVPIMQSNQHIVINPNNNNFDKYILQDVTTQYARQVPIRVSEDDRPFRAIVINGIDQISKQAQMSLRSTMENYSKQCRFIMWCTKFYKVIKPLRSRCFCVRLRAPTEEEVQGCLARAMLSFRLPSNLLHVLDTRTRDLRGAFRKLEAARWGVDEETSYDTQIKMIVRLILEHNSDNLSPIRAALYELMITNFTGTQIITSIVDNIMTNEHITDDIKVLVCERAALYESRNVVARREIKHLEAFAIAAMNRIRLPEDAMKKLLQEKEDRIKAERAAAAKVAKAAADKLAASKKKKNKRSSNKKKKVVGKAS